MRRRMLLAAVSLALAACESPTIPPRPAAYDFTLPVTDGPAMVFHWPAGSEVRVYVSATQDERGALLRSAVDAGMAAWNKAVLFDEYRLTRALRPAESEVVVVWADDPEPPVLINECPPDPARAVTTFCSEPGDLRKIRPFRLTEAPTAPSAVRFLITLGAREHEDPDRLRRLVAHELGHALGIMRHSPEAEDLMHSLAAVNGPSVRDRHTIQILYHTTPDLRP